MKFIKNNLLLIIVNVLALTEAFVGTVCLIAVRHSLSVRTGCRRCGRDGKTPRLCSRWFFLMNFIFELVYRSTYLNTFTVVC